MRVLFWLRILHILCSSCSILPFGGAFGVGWAQADGSVLASVDVASGLVFDAHVNGVPDLQVKHLRGVRVPGRCQLSARPELQILSALAWKKHKIMKCWMLLPPSLYSLQYTKWSLLRPSNYSSPPVIDYDNWTIYQSKWTSYAGLQGSTSAFYSCKRVTAAFWKKA